jgi:hypothetical protein
MGPHFLLAAATLVMLSLAPVLIHLGLALPRIVVATYSGTVLLIGLIWLGWVLLAWSESQW